MSRGLAMLVAWSCAYAHADTQRHEHALSSPMWRSLPDAPVVTRLWGTGPVLYAIGPTALHRSSDRGESWSVVRGVTHARGVWGTGAKDVWVASDRSVAHSIDGNGATWRVKSLDMLHHAAVMEGVWGAAQHVYVFGGDRGSDGVFRGAILHSRDRGTSWTSELLPVEVARISAMWGSSSSDVYAVGHRGVILHSAGDGVWHVQRPPTDDRATLEGIWGDAANIYAVGANGTILHTGDRGKTWRPRASGVRYALSSIFGLGREIFVGSADGPPLRSTDGGTWKPITALLARGQVWASDRAHLYAMTPTGIEYFGDAEVRIARAAPVMPAAAARSQAWRTAPSRIGFADDIVMLRAVAAGHGVRFPNARDVALLAAHRLGAASIPSPAKTASSASPARLGTIAGCSDVDDQTNAVIPPRGIEVVVDIACVWTCGANPNVVAKAHATRWENGKASSSANVGFTMQSTVCRAASEIAEIKQISLSQSLKAFARPRSEAHQQALDAARSPDEIEDADARYLLEGGDDPTIRARLAARYGKPVTWRGFFWNP
jgi:photosystem II stability/assembly factor-like uncharacterized protein